MYYPYFVAYIVVGFVISLAAFYWAVRSGQFSHQQRARFLPLVGVPPMPAARTTRWNRFEIYALFSLAVAGVLCIAAVLIFAVFFQP